MSSHKRHTHVFQPGNILSGFPEAVVKYNCKVRYFPDNTIRISCFSRPIYNPDGWEERQDGLENRKDKRKKAESAEAMEEKQPRNDSLKRSLDRAFEIGFSNDFRYFVTLTLDKEKIDRYDLDQIYPKLKNWLSNGVSRWGMDYIIFPEYHKLKEGEEKRAVHFHGLFNGKLALTDSGHKTPEGKPIYNLDGWKYGFSTAVELDGKSAVIYYVTKYISKENERIFGRSYLSGGRSLKREIPAEYLNMDYESFDGDEYHIKAANMSVKYKTFSLGE